MLCTRCKKRIAVVFMSQMQNDKPTGEGYCIPCARELGITQVDDMMAQLGITDDQLEMMDSQMQAFAEQMGEMDTSDMDDEEGFEPGGAQTFNILNNMFSNNSEPKSPKSEDDSDEKDNKQEKISKEKIKKDKKTQRERKKSYLGTYCTNLTTLAKQGKIDKIVGRSREIYRVMQILNRRTKNNPCLTGEPGVGKTAIAEGIAIRIAQDDVPFKLKGKELYLLDLTALVAGTQFRGQFESRIKGLVDEVKEAGNIILFIDEVHNLIGTGDAEGSMNAANILKPALSRGEVQVIGATTFNEYRKYIEKDAALERRFQPVSVEEPSISDTNEMVDGIKQYYEQYHNVKVTRDIVLRAVLLSERYITDRFLPDKAIDLLDEACSHASLDSKELTKYLSAKKDLEQNNEKLETLEADVEDIDYEGIATCKAEIIRLEAEVEKLSKNAENIYVTEMDLAKAIELWTGIPAAKIQQEEYARLMLLEQNLGEKIIGQDEAISLVAAAIKRAKANITPRHRPASFIFAGPTGVGKTELVKVLANEMFDSVDPLIRLDMSEYMEKYAVSKMIGSPPGYVGYDEAGQLTERVRRRPYSVLLFDEIEKAHPDVMNILLQILDEGRITDSHGRTVNFENTIIVMTSNAGSDKQQTSLGFSKSTADISREKVTKALSDFLRPEFLARVDEVVIFSPLSEQTLTKIAGLMLDELREPLHSKGIDFN